MPAFSPYDYAALAWFFVAWAGYTVLADHSCWARHSISAAMARYRHRWMHEMLDRDLRMVDTQILGNLITGIGFFASTAILMIGGLFALLGAADRAIQALARLPFAEPSGTPEWELKVLLLIAMFVYAFFKFAWSFRLANYCSILVGAAPHKPADRAAAERAAARVAEVSIRVAHHFNRGLRAFFFALAVLAWFIHPALFAAATVFVVAVLYRREFRSSVLEVLKESP